MSFSRSIGNPIKYSFIAVFLLAGLVCVIAGGGQSVDEIAQAMESKLTRSFSVDARRGFSPNAMVLPS